MIGISYDYRRRDYDDDYEERRRRPAPADSYRRSNDHLKEPLPGSVKYTLARDWELFQPHDTDLIMCICRLVHLRSASVSSSGSGVVIIWVRVVLSFPTFEH